MPRRGPHHEDAVIAVRLSPERQLQRGLQGSKAERLVPPLVIAVGPCSSIGREIKRSQRSGGTSPLRLYETRGALTELVAVDPPRSVIRRVVDKDPVHSAGQGRGWGVATAAEEQRGLR